MSGQTGLPPVVGPASEKNIVACLSTGRSGTALLAQLMALADDCHACHEPRPTYEAVTESVRWSEQDTLAFVRDVKLPAIRSVQAANYVETSHLFGKGPIDAFIDLGTKFNLVVLNRDPRAVASSMWRVKAIPGRSRKRQAFLLHPGQSNVLHLADWKRLSDYQLCFWYCLEIERRKDFYKKRCERSGLAAVETHLHDLLAFDRFTQFCSSLGLHVSARARERHAEIVAVRHNAKPGMRRAPWRGLRDLDRQENEVWMRLGAPYQPLREAIAARYFGEGPKQPNSANESQRSRDIAGGTPGGLARPLVPGETARGVGGPPKRTVAER